MGEAESAGTVKCPRCGGYMAVKRLHKGDGRDLIPLLVDGQKRRRPPPNYKKFICLECGSTFSAEGYTWWEKTRLGKW